MEDAPRAVAVYCRLSFALNGSVEKVEQQEADCRALASHLGWRVRDVYPDNSKSAWQRNRKRPQWDRMLGDIKAGVIDGIIVYHGDRLIRQPLDLEALLKLADDRHIPLASPQGTRDLNSEDDRFILRIEVAQACKASADTSRRVRRAQDARTSKGLGLEGGNRPFGWGAADAETGEFDLTIQNPEEAAVLRGAVDRLLTGQTQGGVLAWMNTCSTTTRGNRWTARALRHLLASPRISGQVMYRGELRDAVWDGIVTPAEWEDLKEVLHRKSEAYAYPGHERRHLLTGLAKCGTCGKKVRVKPASGRGRKPSLLYYCDNLECSKRVSRSLRHLDAYVTGRVLRRLSEAAFIDAIHADKESPGLGAEIAALRRRKADAVAKLEDLADHPDLDPSLLARSLGSYDRKIAQLRDQMGASSERRLLARMAGISAEQWEAEPIDIRAETARILFVVTILPTSSRAPGFDPSSVKVERVEVTPDLR